MEINIDKVSKVTASLITLGEATHNKYRVITVETIDGETLEITLSSPYSSSLEIQDKL